MAPDGPFLALVKLCARSVFRISVDRPNRPGARIDAAGGGVGDVRSAPRRDAWRDQLGALAEEENGQWARRVGAGVPWTERL